MSSLSIPAIDVIARLLRVHEGRGDDESRTLARQMLDAASADKDSVKGNYTVAPSFTLDAGEGAVAFRGTHVDVYQHPEQPEKITEHSPLYQVMRVRVLFSTDPECVALREKVDEIIRRIMPPQRMQ